MMMILPPLRSMRTRMTIGFVMFTSIVVFISVVMLMILLQHIALTRAVAHLDNAYASAQTIVNKYTEDHRDQKIPLSVIMRENQGDITDSGVVAQVLDIHGKVVWRSQKGLPQWVPNIKPWRWRALTLYQERLILSIPQQTIQLKVMERSWALIALGALVVLGTALGVWTVVGRTLSPISELSRQVQRASRDGLKMRLEQPSPDAEIVELVSTFNDLLEHLGKEADIRSRFYAIASHELRTPLQALSGHLELSLSRHRSNDEYHKVISESLTQTQRLISLVQTLLQLYQIENRSLPDAIEIDLSKIIDYQLSLLHPWVERRNLAVCREVDSLNCYAIPGHFDIMVRNLVENALKYSRRDCPIFISLHEVERKVLLRIRNQYDPTAAAATKTTSERRSPKVESYGLGMTICQAVASANEWQMEMIRKDGQMSVEVWLGKCIK